MITTRRLVGFGLALAGLVLAGQASGEITIDGGPLFPPPGGVTWSAAGSLGNTGGITYSFSNLNPAETAELYWGMSNVNLWSTQPTGLSLNGSTITGSEIFGALGDSQMSSTVWRWLGQTSMTDNHSGSWVTHTADTRLTVTISGDASGAWISDSTTAALDSAFAKPRALWNVRSGSFQANLLMEAYSPHTGWRPYEEVYDPLHTPQSVPTMGSFAGAFYYEERSPDFDEDGDVDLDDLNLLTAEANLPIGLSVPPADTKFDLSGNDVIDSADLDIWLTDSATINGFGSPYLKGDANLDGDVDVWAFDGSGDAQLLSNNLGTTTGAVWGDGDFNGDGDVDVWEFAGFGDAQQLSSNLGSNSDADPGTAEAIYNAVTGELSFDVGAGIGVIGVEAQGMMHHAVDATAALGAPAQNADGILAYFSASGLPVGMADAGFVLPPGLTADDIGFSYTPIGKPGTIVPVTIIVPEPSTIAMLLILGVITLHSKRRKA